MGLLAETTVHAMCTTFFVLWRNFELYSGHITRSTFRHSKWRTVNVVHCIAHREWFQTQPWCKMLLRLKLVWPWPEHNKQPIEYKYYITIKHSAHQTHQAQQSQLGAIKKGKTVRDENEATSLKWALGLSLWYRFCEAQPRITHEHVP